MMTVTAVVAILVVTMALTESFVRSHGIISSLRPSLKLRMSQQSFDVTSTNGKHSLSFNVGSKVYSIESGKIGRQVNSIFYIIQCDFRRCHK
jgi:hypothetical protein